MSDDPQVPDYPDGPDYVNPLEERKKPMSEPATQKTTVAYYVGGDAVIEENDNGTYSIAYKFYSRLTREEMITLHAVLGQVLTDLAALVPDHEGNLTTPPF